MKPIIYLLATLLLLPSAQASWINVSGQANIINSDIAQARKDAMLNALENASYMVTDNAAHSDKTAQKAKTVTRSITDQPMRSAVPGTANFKILNERIENDVVIVNIRINSNTVKPARCHGSELRSAIFIPQAEIKNRAQLRHGNIGQFEQNLSIQLGKILEQNAKNSFPFLHADERLDIDQSLAGQRGYRLPSWINELTDSQYILIPEIIDISAESPSSMFGVWENTPTREFQLNISLFHGISGEKLWGKYYSSPAKWEFKRQQTVNSSSSKFWRSEYGSNILNVLEEVRQDLDETLKCRPLLGQIVARDNDRVILNIGRMHGIHVGDKLQIVLQQNIPDKLNHIRTVAALSPASITIDQISENSATATLEDIDSAYNIQINDLAIKMN